MFEKAITVYQAGLAISKDSPSTSNLRINLASAFVGAGRPQDAIAIYQQMLASNTAGINQWQLYLALSQLYAQTGDMAQARSNAQLALQAVPANDTTDQKSVQDWLSRLGP
jgi:pentatricopeptide repeat protein